MRNGAIAPKTLAHLPQGEAGILDRLDLPEDIARRLMELGFLPGHIIVPARSAPGGEPRVYRVDGSEVALRRETAARLILRAAIERHRKDPTSYERLPRLRGLRGCVGTSSVAQVRRCRRTWWRSSARRTPANRRCSIASPGCAKRSPISPASRWSSASAARAPRPTAKCPGRPARRLQPESALGRRAGHARCAGRRDARHPEAGCGAADSRLHQPRPPPGAGRSDSQPETSDAGHPEHGRRPAQPRRQGGHGGARQPTRRSGGADQRGQGRRRRKSFSVHGRHLGRHHVARGPQSRTAGAAGHPALPAVGAPSRHRARRIKRPRLRCGRAGWMRSSCIPSRAWRSSSWWWRRSSKPSSAWRNL